jgi:two-component system NarL family sensor kinase
MPVSLRHSGGVTKTSTAAFVRRPPLVLLCLLAPIAVQFWLALATPSDGTRSVPGWGRWSAEGLTLDRAPAGAEAGDVVVAVDHRPVGEVIPGVGRQVRAGERHVYTVHTGETSTKDVRVRLARPSSDEVVRLLLPALPLVLCLDVVAVAVFRRRPGYPPSQLVLLLGVLVPLTVTDWPAGPSISELTSDHLSIFFGSEIAAGLCWSALLHFVLVFPSPLPFIGRHRWTLAVPWLLPLMLYGARLMLAHGQGDAIQRLERELAFSTPSTLLFPPLLVLLIVWRYAREPGSSRIHLRWLLAGLVSSMGLFSALAVVPDLLGIAQIPPPWQPLILALLPLSVGAAILQYRLFDVEVVLRRSLIWGGLTGLLLAVYVGAAWLLGEFLGPGPVLLLVSGVFALTILRLGARLQSTALRLVYGSRQDPYIVVSDLLAIDTGATPQQVLDGVAALLARSLRLNFVGVELTWENGTPLAYAEHGSTARPPMEIPLLHGDRRVGRLRLDIGARQEPFGPADQALLDGVAHQLGGAGYSVLLAAALQQSRERLITAREEERRRIRRDLHDGLGPGLAAGAMQLEVARTLVTEDPREAEKLLDRLHVGALAAIADVRRLVDDLRPSSLDQLGLVSALREVAHDFTTGAPGAPRVNVSVPTAMPTLPAAIEVAAYKIVVEAMTNVVRHAGASHCQVTLALDRDLLLLLVTDDGHGIPEVFRRGIGLSSMTERAAELGGLCVITRSAEGGTVVTARLPLLKVVEPT